jgi:hypothetical protein
MEPASQAAKKILQIFALDLVCADLQPASYSHVRSSRRAKLRSSYIFVATKDLAGTKLSRRGMFVATPPFRTRILLFAFASACG